jgi:hypothetical protein
MCSVLEAIFGFTKTQVCNWSTVISFVYELVKMCETISEMLICVHCRDVLCYTDFSGACHFWFVSLVEVYPNITCYMGWNMANGFWEETVFIYIILGSISVLW